ncbi:unnamed protein product [Linum tenue]|uniref:AB hydrolase-1 domain-containing protein n=2 Tax=Linum tenue TaxID=586396 RepID=A0AAV0JGJ0_9ROSI|nr:unnamed protein product [Linum tenue]
MRHFVLVHGACHGAWCWYKVIAELKQAGHKVTALDLTACGIDRRQVEDVHGSVVEYSKPLLTFMASLPAAGSDDEKVILVGHSMAGSSLCMAMERFPEKISVAAFLAAGMLGPDLTSQMVDEKFVELSPTADTMDSQVIYGDGPDKPPTGFLLGPKHMETHLYRCSPRQVKVTGRPAGHHSYRHIDVDLCVHILYAGSGAGNNVGEAMSDLGRRRSCERHGADQRQVRNRCQGVRRVRRGKRRRFPVVAH